MKLKNYWLLLLLSAFIFSCQNKEEIFRINGTFNKNYKGKIYLSEITPEGPILLDSTIVKANQFRFKIKKKNHIPQPAFYQLWTSSVNGLVTIGREGETVNITADPENMVKSYLVSGGDDAILMWQLDQMLKTFIDTIDRLYNIYETYIEEDSVREEIELKYQELLCQYQEILKKFISENKTSLVVIPAFYQVYNRRRFLDENENSAILKMILDELRVQFPNNENVIWLEKRVKIV